MHVARDDELLEDFRKSGEIRHFDKLVRRHIGKVRAMIYPMVLNDADADELTQDVFVRVMSGISRFKKKSLFSSWLYRITMNTTRSFLRKRARRPVDSCEVLPELTDRRPGPASALEHNEHHARVTEAMAMLSPVLRSAITLTAIHGMSAKEAAGIEGCRASTMHWRVHEARRILKEKLGCEA